MRLVAAWSIFPVDAQWALEWDEVEEDSTKPVTYQKGG
jgi:hypothetical protein